MECGKANHTLSISLGGCYNAHALISVFTSQFLEVLLLRLAFSCALATNTSTESDGPSLRKCTIWKNGVFWGDRYGVETLVEMQSDSKEVVVLIRSFQENLTAFLQLHSSIIRKVLTTVSDFVQKLTLLNILLILQR